MIEYWKIRKAQLPEWRSSTSQRSQWERALSEHSKAPIIDAAMLRPADLKEYTSGPAFDLLLARHNQMFGSLATGWKNQMNAEFNPGSTVEQYHTFLNNRLGLPEVSLETLAEMEKEGISISGRLAQLGLTPQAFRFLLKIERVLAAEESITDDEKDQVHYIVMNVLKERNAHIYQLEELTIENGPITHSQDFFRHRKPDYTQYPVEENAPLKPWLASETTRYQWRRKIKSRMDQESSVSDAVEEMAYNTDEKFIHLLRDTLIEAVGDNELTFYENARILGDRFLIDLENNCCFKTNRVALAIEVLQQLHWKTRTGAILAEYPDVKSLTDDFDAAWQWMGNYSNWRAAMFVFLYPENLMIPALRKKQTPAFKKVIEATRNNRRFNPEQACELAREYQLSIKGIKDLDLKCSARVLLNLGEIGCNPSTNKIDDVIFHFATSRSSGKSWYLITDPVIGNTAEQLNYWLEIPDMNNTEELVGSQIYINKDFDINHIYLFFLDKKEASRFFCKRYNLMENRWESEENLSFEMSQEELHCTVSYWNADTINVVLQTQDEMLPVPDSVALSVFLNYYDALKSWYSGNNFSTDIKSIALVKNQPSTSPPRFAISLYNNNANAQTFMTFHRRMDFDGKNLEEHSWKSTKAFDKLTFKFSFDNNDFTFHNFITDEGEVTSVSSYNLVASNQSEPDLEGKVKEFISTNSYPTNNYWNTRWFLELIGPETEAFSRHRVLYRLAGPNTSWRVSHHEFLSSRSLNILSFQHGHSSITTGYSLLLNHLDMSFAIIDISDPEAIIKVALSSGGALANAKICHYVTQFLPDSEDSESLNFENNQRQFPYQFFTGNTDCELRSWSFDETTNSISMSEFKLLLTLRGVSAIGFINNDTTISSLQSRQQVSQLLYNYHIEEKSYLIEYVKEFFYYTPLQIALQLTQTGHYLEALSWYRTIYDHTQPIGERKIYYGLIAEENIDNIFERTQNWFEDPLNPHAVAGMRRHSYTRYTIMCIVQCLLAYADAEFTTDTAETVPRARELYEQALALLKLITPLDDCPTEEIIDSFPEFDIDPIWQDVLERTLEPISKISNSNTVVQVTDDVKTIMQSEDSDEDKITQVQSVIATALNNQEPQNFEDLFSELNQKLSSNTEWATGHEGINKQLEYVSRHGTKKFAETMYKVTGFNETDLLQQSIRWLADPSQPMTEYQGKDTWPMNPTLRSMIDGMSISNPKSAFNLNSPLPGIHISGVPFSFCAVTNPMITALLMHAHVNLFKIRNCMNIAGMVRELSPFAAPTDASSGVPSIGVGGSLSLPINLSVPPSAYRYRVLMERAKQLVSLAQQMEGAFLTALEKFDAVSYSILRADQDIESSRANIKLQELKVIESESNVTLTELQQERSILQVNGLLGMINGGLLDIEKTIIQQIAAANALSIAAAVAGAAAGAAANWNVAPAAAAYVAQGVAQGFAINAHSQIQKSQIQASFERRKQEWEFQKTLAEHDIRIGGQQIKIANDRLRISGQEREMAQLQNTHAQASLDFLKNKFTSAELYEFMTRILEDVYEFFLMEATAVAKMAERQLAFERQLELPPFIKSDYWVYEDGSLASGVGESESPDRRGITGSARLLKDLYDLDQHGFMTNTPRLQMTKNISLNQLDPVAMQQLRDTGKMTFYTTQEMFDRDYPGHYLRLIKGVSVSVIALTPPIEGIKATLTNGGTSSVITGGNIFQKRVIKRQPEQIALSNPAQDKGLLPMQAESEFLHPFEGSGVETLWELRMDKPANPFDFSTIADVIFTIEYEATNSFTYRQTVLNQLNNEPYPGALVLSFKNNLPDQWYELHNPQEGDPDQLSVTFQVGADDLMVHTQAPEINSVKLFVAGSMPEDSGTDITIGLQTVDDDGELQDVASATRVYSDKINLLDFTVEMSGNNVDPKGKWSLTFPNYNQIRNLFQQEKIEDIILVINYDGLPVPYTS